MISILKSLGIKTKVALPGVGESMQDHQSMSMRYSVNGTLSGKFLYATMPTARDVFGDRLASVAASTRAKLGQWARQTSALTGGAISALAIEQRYRVQHDLIFKKNSTVAELFPTAAGTTLVAQFWTSLPFSWGSVHLGHKDRIEEPVIDPRTAMFDFDVEMLAAVGKLNQKAYSTAPLSSVISAYDPALPLGSTDEEWKTYVRNTGKFRSPVSVSYLG